MGAAPGWFLSDVFEEHLDAIAFLWGQRQSALRSPDYTAADLLDLEDSLEAHIDGVRAAGEASIPILEEELTAEEPLRVFAAAYALLHHENETTQQRLLDAFAQAEGPRLAALRDAFCHGPARTLLPQIERLYRTAPSPVAAAAAEVLAFHSALKTTSQDLQRFLQDDDPAVRDSGWHVAAYVGAAVEPKTYAAAVRDGDAALRRAALYAGAWCGEHGVLAVCRKLGADPKPDNLDVLELLAILGGPEDRRLFATVACTDALGPDRFHIVGTYGDPELMDLVLAGLADPNPAVAAAAGAAFTKITGQNVDSERKAKLPPEGGGEPDEFEAEFQEEVTLPDPELARQHWELMKPVVQHASRLRRSFDVGGKLDPQAFAELDMESRWEVCLRARFSGAWSGSPVRLERFPHGRGAQAST